MSQEGKPTTQDAWIHVDDALPEYSLTSVWVLQVFFNPDGKPRFYSGDPEIGVVHNVALAHCHGPGDWRGFGYGLRDCTPKPGCGGWRVVAWRLTTDPKPIFDRLLAQHFQAGEA